MLAHPGSNWQRAEFLQEKAAPGTAPPGEVQRCTLDCSRTNAVPWLAVMQDWDGCCHTGDNSKPLHNSFLAEWACGPHGSQQENSGILTRWMFSQDELHDELGVFFNLVLTTLSAHS